MTTYALVVTQLHGDMVDVTEYHKPPSFALGQVLVTASDGTTNVTFNTRDEPSKWCIGDKVLVTVEKVSVSVLPFEKGVLATPGAEERVAEIADELVEAVG